MAKLDFLRYSRNPGLRKLRTVATVVGVAVAVGIPLVLLVMGRVR